MAPSKEGWARLLSSVQYTLEPRYNEMLNYFVISIIALKYNIGHFGAKFLTCK